MWLFLGAYFFVIFLFLWALLTTPGPSFYPRLMSRSSSRTIYLSIYIFHILYWSGLLSKNFYDKYSAKYRGGGLRWKMLYMFCKIQGVLENYILLLFNHIHLKLKMYCVFFYSYSLCSNYWTVFVNEYEKVNKSPLMNDYWDSKLIDYIFSNILLWHVYYMY